MKLPVHVAKILSKRYGALIGKGSFSRAYRKENSDQVTVISVDKVKECIAHFSDFFNTALFPEINFHDDDLIADQIFCNLSERYGNPRIYTMPFYEKVVSLKGTLKPDQWKLYKILRALSNRAMFIETDCNYLIDLFHKHLDTEYPRYAEELESAISSLSNYGYDLRFEISPRNVRVSGEGQLILLDCFFFKGDLP